MFSLLAKSCTSVLVAAMLPMITTTDMTAGDQLVMPDTAVQNEAGLDAGNPSDVPDEQATFSQLSRFAPGITYDKVHTTVSGQPVRTNVITVANDAAVVVRPVMAGEPYMQGLATVPAMARAHDALFATNGAFWSTSPGGNPNGTYIVDGNLESEPETQGTGPRGTIGWDAHGNIVVDRLSGELSLTLPSGEAVRINGINRNYRFKGGTPDGMNAAVGYSSRFGSKISVKTPYVPDPNWKPPAQFAAAKPAGKPAHPSIGLPITTVRLQVSGWPASGSRTATVIGFSRREGTYTVRANELLIQAKGSVALQLAKLNMGDQVTLNTKLIPLDPGHEARWTNIKTAIAGGPRVVANGKVTSPAEWESEGFANNVHNFPRHPRTAIGVTADGKVVLMTADGRHLGTSVGFSMQELGNYLVSLGVTDAVSLDGGGSTQLTVEGQLDNHPASSPLRHVANSIQITPFKRNTTRVSGKSRVATAANLATSKFNPGETPTIVLARADSYPDALAGGALAGAVGGPMLLTANDHLSAETKAAITTLQSSHIVLLGGTNAISPAVEAELAQMGKTVVRLAGKGRIETANAIAEQIRSQKPDSHHAFIVAADSWADALVASPPAGLMGSPILLTGGDGLAPATKQALTDLEVTSATVIGGKAKLSDQVVADLQAKGITVERIAGKSRWETALKVSDWTQQHVPHMSNDLVLATGTTFADALAAGPYASRYRLPLIIVPSDNLRADPDLTPWVEAKLRGASHATVVGGFKAISTPQIMEIDDLIPH